MTSPLAAKAEATSKDRTWPVVWWAFALAAIAASLTSRVWGYETVKINPGLETPQAVKSMKLALKSYVVGNATDPNTVARVNAFMKQYVPARITRPDGLAEISPLLDDIQSAITLSMRSGDRSIQEKLTSDFFGVMSVIAKRDYQPAARVAATVAIGKLDSDPGDLRSVPPTPLPQALPALVGLYRDPKAPDGVKAAALHGIDRHVRLTFNKMPQNYKDGIKAMMTELLKQPTPAGRPADAHAYLQRYAVNILDLLNDPQDPQIAGEFLKISADSSQHDLIALHAAAKFGRSKADLKGKLDAPVAILDQWSLRAYRAFEDEVQRLETYLNRPANTGISQPKKPEEILQAKAKVTAAASGYGGYGGPGGGGSGSEEPPQGYGSGYGGGGGGGPKEEVDPSLGYGGGYGAAVAVVEEYDPQPAEVIATRRRLNEVLQSLQLAVAGTTKPGVPSQPGGLLAATDDASRAEVQNWLREIEATVTKLNDKSLEDRDKFLTSLKEQLETMKSLASAALKAQEDAAQAAGDEPTDIPPAVTELTSIP